MLQSRYMSRTPSVAIAVACSLASLEVPTRIASPHSRGYKNEEMRLQPYIARAKTVAPRDTADRTLWALLSAFHTDDVSAHVVRVEEARLGGRFQAEAFASDGFDMPIE